MPLSMKETLGQHYNRKPRPPLISAAEFAESIGKTVKQLGNLLRDHDGPKPILNHGSSSGRWYDKAEMKKWWKGLQNEQFRNDIYSGIL